MREGNPTSDIEYPGIDKILEAQGLNPATILDIGRLGLKTSELVDRFADIKRVPRRRNGERESDVEHSFMLAMIAPTIAKAIRPDLDTDLVRQYALVHDIIELETGDVATFNVSPEEQAEKERREREAISLLSSQLPELEAVALASYEAQKRPEARFVRMVDKLLPAVVDITGQGTRVVEEDFGISNLEET